MGDQILTDKKSEDWKLPAFLAIGIVVGLLAGAQLNTEQTAKGMAAATCGVCQDNLGIMVKNFNTLVRECPNLNGKVPDYKNFSVGNQTVRVYAP